MLYPLIFKPMKYIQKKLEAIGHKSIKEFVDYCDKHSTTPMAYFRKDEYALILRLAGSPKYHPRPQEIEQRNVQMYSLHEEMGDLVARYRLIDGQLQKSNSFKDLLQVAMMILDTTHGPLAMVSGPISTGGKGSIESNILAMQEYIEELYQAGVNIFDQTPFEGPMQRLKNTAVKYDYDLLNDFYLPIFESGYIKQMFFMYDFESSTGANWEHEQMIRLHIKRNYQTLKV